MQYSGKDGKRCTVFEITSGRVDMGGDISILSQYPGEKEFLMQPLSCLEVRAHMYVCLVIPSHSINLLRCGGSMQGLKRNGKGVPS